MYIIVAIVTYRYAGTDVASPALGSTSPLLRKLAYGIAIPTIVIAGMYIQNLSSQSYTTFRVLRHVSRAKSFLSPSKFSSRSSNFHRGKSADLSIGVVNGHVASKYIYVRLFRGTDRMSKRSWSSFGLWAIIVLILWVIAWIIAEAIPVFNDLLSLISALFASWFTYGLSGVFWLYMNYGQYRSSRRKMFLTGVNVGCFCLGAIIVSSTRFSSSYFSRCALGSKLLTLVVVRIRTVFVWDGDQQRRYKLPRKLLVRGQFKNLGLTLCHLSIIMRLHSSLLAWSSRVLWEGIIQSNSI